MTFHELRTKSNRRRPALHPEMSVNQFVKGQLNEFEDGIQVSRRLWTRHFSPRPIELVKRDARQHPRGARFLVPAGLRAIANFIDTPGCVISGLSALAVLGLPYFADACSTTLNSNISCIKGNDSTEVVLRRRKAKSSWTVNWHGVDLDISAPVDAVIEAVQDLRDGVHTWAVPSWVTDPILFRAVSVIDAGRRFIGVDLDELEKAAMGRVSKRWFRKALKLSSQLADSPKETEMRLMCEALINNERIGLPYDIELWNSLKLIARHRNVNLDFREQVPLYRGEMLVTVFDIAFPELKIALMYDGEHHLERGQRDKDSSITLECTLQGWTVLRFSAGTLQNLPLVLARVLEEKLGLGKAA